MVIRLDENYNAMTSTALLGYVGETNARPVSVEGMEIDGADRYVLTIDYGDGVAYEVDITGGQWTPTADILRSAQTVSCQIAAKKLSGDEYVLVKKSRIFRLRIGAAIGDNAVPSPSVATDALDRIDAIGRQAHADMQTAVTAAETATTAAENAEKSATTAGVSADTATQAASRAETAKTSAETSATQAETAMQGAETARTEAVTAQNAAKISAAQASASAQQTEADKTITAGYAKTAKTCADSTTADRQAVQEMAEQVTVDKTTVAENATKVAEDRTAAEAAAQKAQSVADSLPEDYVTAVAQIAKNTAEIANVKLTDKELQRRVNALYDMGNGVTHKFETDSETAYQKTIPTGAKLMSVKSVGGHSEVIDGEIVSAGTESVVEQGKNLFDYTDKTYHGTNVSKVENGVIYTKQLLTTILNIPTIVGNKYTLSLKTKSISTSQGILRWSLQKGKNTAYADDSSLIKKVVGTVANTEYQETVTFTATTDFVSLCGLATAFYDVQLEESDAATDYSPFYQTEYLIPEAIKALPGYGWSAGTAKNWVDYENKKYYQCVDSVDLGTLTWMKTSSQSSVGDYFYAPVSAIGFKRLGAFGITVHNILCSKYITVARNPNAFVDKTIVLDGDSIAVSQIQVKDTAYTDATAFKQAMSGVMLYYELANPIVTDISTLIPDDFLRNIEIEAGGSVTFKNSNGDSYRIPVPSEEEYIVKLSEIGGTT
ncbi:hypothetical protein [Ruminococcus bicirculans (ex Wegman et al. 2014)]|uniref:hypothetical protein n=1 Tax=Ruminococcus bicirculans (ex Wegman et al. 2014) TaxID=1160721 RepID=UPI00242A4D5F|nr:hypothetical protein [Ruminococcus bicirculans (ex Wegman et al. 2014)]